ncbi:DUF1338 domain protein [Periconia macrospinosa]|uniref:2-oxoadipate dioxygenase/decarboxylase n=1 Tax=Periconia macrospinosa TaxID=97972 RepID=A0A2V1DMP4_9PLEO|nr:DUF1338 domain protein [Periconia macrospinosa]
MAPALIECHKNDLDKFIEADDLRTAFALSLSSMYKKEVPLYGDLIRLVAAVNKETLETSSNPKIEALRHGDVAKERLDIERHGAIRLGTPYELRTVRRMCAILGMYPIGYYDLSPAGLPMHATCFRPKSKSALMKNPFRIFTTLLRPDFISDGEAKEVALELLSRRSIFSDELIELIEKAEGQGGKLQARYAAQFVREAMKTFGWRPVAAASREAYSKLRNAHPILADVACFHSAHINHLTPRTLDISLAQQRMRDEGMAAKASIEGPPARSCPILLRQTSFLALEEPISFPGSNGALHSGSHKARFGEIEERGAAVTPKGRKLYDALLEKAQQAMDEDGAIEPEKALANIFGEFPDNWTDLRRQGLVYFEYRCLKAGIVEAIPITYEDFLPLSAAGIFQSNLGSGKPSSIQSEKRDSAAGQAVLETALGATIADMHASYEDIQNASLRNCAQKLGIAEEELVGA